MKAKDLAGRNIEDIEDLKGNSDSESPEHEEDQVSAAYENISKRLSSLRGGASEESDESAESKGTKDSEEPELEEWKGPKPPVLKHDEPEEEHELKKVNLRNLEDKEEPKDKKDEDEIDPLDDEDEKDEEKVVKKDWQPKENDPLDDEDAEEETAVSKEEEPEIEEIEKETDLDEPAESEKTVEKDVEAEEPEELHSEISAKSDETALSEEEKGPDTLDDLADESPFGQKPKRTEDELPYNRAASAEEDDDYSIPNLKGSGQTGANMEYNAHPQRESVGESYAPKGGYMEGNDPNNFFSQHQPQAPKRANKFHLLILIIIGMAVIGFTVYILKGGFGGINLGTSMQSSPSPSPTATPEPTPTPTPEPEVNRGDFTVRVLNGTSTSGLAKTVGDKLKEAGFKIAAPGNAEDSDVEQTEIRVKEGSASATLFERIKLDLAPDYDAKEGEKLDAKTKHDAEVIIGAK